MNPLRVILTLTFFFTVSVYSKDKFKSPPTTLGISPDCSERRTTIEEIKSIANNPKVKTMVDFLNALPKNSLQTFTFVKETSSSQHHLVSDQWPRVLRMSTDGKIVISFVCNKDSQDYGSVEILHFEDPPHARWRSLSLDFEKPDPEFKGLTARALTNSQKTTAHADSKTCLNCHGVGSDQSLRPIFHAYPIWPGFYGSEDDALFKGERELSRYQQFKKLAATNPCFNTLPWPKNKVYGYEEYPYNLIERFTNETKPGQRELYLRKLKTDNYHLRANLKFTDAFSHLNAQRIAHKFLRNKAYQALASTLAMEALACEKVDLLPIIKKTLGDKYGTPRYTPDSELNDPRSVDSRTLHLYNVGLQIGITPNEWTLHFNKPTEPEYATGIHGAHGYDTSTAQIVQGLLFQELAQSIPALKDKYKLTRGVSGFFNKQDFSCIDDLGGALEFTADNQNIMCQALYSDIQKNAVTEMTIPQDSLANPLPVVASETTHPSSDHNPSMLVSLDHILKKIGPLKSSADTLKIGNSLALTYCLACHGPQSYLPQVYQFLTTEDIFRKSVTTDPMLLHRALAYTESGRMPIGYKLTKDQKTALQNYLIKLAEGVKK
ncbi:MAG: hypothetical protein JNL11_07945 [Bdellovibrionaceae bacterium]|nr:hypothetical protein [Pseudobdellovibrionaceae bacterium]